MSSLEQTKTTKTNNALPHNNIGTKCIYYGSNLKKINSKK